MTDNNPSGPKENGDGGNQPAAKEHAVAIAINALKSEYESAQKDRPEHDRQVLLWTKRTAKGVFIYTALTVAIVGASVWQGWVARDTEKRQLRPYLETRSIKPFEFTDNKFAKIIFETRNNGQTPAYHVTFFPQIGIFPYPPPRLLGIATPRPDNFFENVVNPQRTLTEEAFSPRAFSNEEIASIKDGSKARLYVWGTVFYWDAFNIERHTDVCEIVGGRDMKSSEACGHVGSD